MKIKVGDMVYTQQDNTWFTSYDQPVGTALTNALDTLKEALELLEKMRGWISEDYGGARADDLLSRLQVEDKPQTAREMVDEVALDTKTGPPFSSQLAAIRILADAIDEMRKE